MLRMPLIGPSGAVAWPAKPGATPIVPTAHARQRGAKLVLWLRGPEHVEVHML